MKTSLPKPLKAALAASGILSLAACGPLISFGDDGPADEVYSLEYSGDYGNFSPDAPIIYFDEPLMAEGLGGRKMAVRLADFRRSTVAGVGWSANLADLMRGYFARSVAAKTDAQIIGEGGLDIEVGCRLGIHVWAFELVPNADPSKDKVSSVIEFSLVNIFNGKLLGKQTFKSDIGVAGNSGQAIAAAFNEAMAQSSTKVADWIGGMQDQCRLTTAG